MMDAPSVIVLDIDDTLYDYHSAHVEGSRRAASFLFNELAIDTVVFSKMYAAARAEVKSQLGSTGASHSRLLYFKILLERLGLHSRLDLAYRLDSEYWAGFIVGMSLEDSALKLLQKARQLGIPVVLATDLTTAIQIRKIIKLGIHPYVHGMLTSEEVGQDKPAPEFAGLLRKRFPFDFSRGWVIGDDHEKDGGLARGLDCLFMQTPAVRTRGRFFDGLTRVLQQ